jgi:acetolactate synthase I/II/III large subunit
MRFCGSVSICTNVASPNSRPYAVHRDEPFHAPQDPDPAAEEPPAEQPDGHSVDPRAAMRAVAAGAPRAPLFVIGLGHYWWFAATFLRGHPFGSYQLTTEFGSIGQGLPSAIGTALGRPDRDVVLVEGDGSLMMSINELDTAVRAGVRLLVIVMNDHGLGAEAHKLQARGHDPSDARIPPPDFAGLCRTFGGRATRVTSVDELETALRELGPLDGLRLIDVALTPDMMSEPYARALAAEKVG